MKAVLSPLGIIGLGFLLVVLGFVLAMLMVLQVVEATFLLSFLSYTASTIGLFMGLIGAAWYVKLR